MVQVCIDKTPLYNDDTTDLYSEAGVYGARAGDAAPMVVFRQMWLEKSIGQSTPYPGSTNTLTVTISTNVPLVSDCPSPVKIQIWNLYHESTYQQSALLVDLVEVADPPTGSIKLSQHTGLCQGRESGADPSPSLSRCALHSLVLFYSSVRPSVSAGRAPCG
jgi:hypothetical protein